jgi:excisionase family DNA binding protein
MSNFQSWSNDSQGLRCLGNTVCVFVVSIFTYCGELLTKPHWAEAQEALSLPSVEPAVVLTLEEAAHFLRVSPAELEQLALQGRVPGRQLGSYWRFSRAALLEWLAGKDPRSGRSDQRTPTSNPSPLVQADPKREDQTNAESRLVPQQADLLLVPELPVVAGRGMKAAGTTPSGSTAMSVAPVAEPETIGEEPDLGTAEDVALRREWMLLGAREFNFELGLFYVKSEQQDLVLLPSDIGAVPVLALVDQDTFLSSYTLRYALLENLQLQANIALLHQTSTLSIFDNEDSNTDTTWSDLTLTLRRSVLRERTGFPEVIFSAETAIPTSRSSYGLGGSIAFVKRIDPAALFANIRYRYTFSRDFSNVSRLQPEHLVSGALGYAFAVNDTLSLNMSVSGLATVRKRFTNAVLPARERFFLQLGLTSLVFKDLYVEPNVGFALNGASNVTLGISAPYSFSLW